jgi:hypothetical protein
MSNFLAQGKGNPSFCASNEIFGFLISPAELAELRLRLSTSLELLKVARVATAEKIETSISSWSTVHGSSSSSMTFFPLIRGTNIDLNAIVSLTELPRNAPNDVTPQTNLAAAVRAQVPVGGALLLLRDRTNSSIGLLLEVTGKK